VHRLVERSEREMVIVVLFVGLLASHGGIDFAELEIDGIRF
jgi:hypothetical protein